MAAKKKSPMPIVIGVIVLGGGVLGAGFMGVINIPGITPKKKGADQLYNQDAAKLYAEKKEGTAPKPKKQEKPVAKKKDEAPLTDLELGTKKLAGIWNTLETTKLKELTKSWKEPELASVLAKMDKEKVAAFLSALEPEQASKLSRQLQTEMAKLPPQPKK